MSFIEKYPILDIGDKIGFTGYIDFIDWEDATESVMKGYDKYGRSFIVVKTKFIHKDGTILTSMETFFQRWKYDICWMGCGDNYFMETSGGMSEFQFDFLIKLLNEKKIELPVSENIKLLPPFKDCISIEIYS